MKSQFLLSVLSVACGCMLVGCGGGGGSSSAQEPVVDTSSQIKGVVVDGYLVGAKVCLDLNTNWVCDSGEPSAISGAGGQFTLDIAPLKYWETYKSLVLAEVGQDARDEADGKTLKEQGLSAYTLGTAGGPAAVLSPINTLQVAQYLNSGLKDLDEVTKVISLLTDNGMSSTNQDYFSPAAVLTDSERALAKRTARVLVSALSSAQARLKSEVPTVYAANASGLGARAAGLVTQALTDSRPTSSTESEAELSTRINQQLSTIVLSADFEKLLQKTTTLLASSDFLTALGNGLYDVSLLTSTPRSVLAHTSQGDGGAVNVKNLLYRSDAWSPDTSYQSQGGAGYRVLYRNYAQIVGSQVASAQISIDAPIWAKDGTTLLKEKFSGDAAAPARLVQLLARDAEGLSYSSVPALSAVSGSFAAGHKLYQIRRKTLAEEYMFDGVASFFTSLEAFKASPRTCYAGVCWSITKPASGNFSALAGTMKFTTTSNAGSLELGEGKFIEDEIAGVYFLRMLSVPIAVQNRSTLWSAKDGRYPLFADFDNKLWTGRYATSATIWTSEWLLPRDALNAVLSSVPLTPIAP